MSLSCVDSQACFERPLSFDFRLDGKLLHDPPDPDDFDDALEFLDDLLLPRLEYLDDFDELEYRLDFLSRWSLRPRLLPRCDLPQAVKLSGLPSSSVDDPSWSSTVGSTGKFL